MFIEKRKKLNEILRPRRFRAGVATSSRPNLLNPAGWQVVLLPVRDQPREMPLESEDDRVVDGRTDFGARLDVVVVVAAARRLAGGRRKTRWRLPGSAKGRRAVRPCNLWRLPFATASRHMIENESQQHKRGPIQLVPARCPLRSCPVEQERTAVTKRQSTGYGSSMSGRHRRYKGNG